MTLLDGITTTISLRLSLLTVCPSCSGAVNDESEIEVQESGALASPEVVVAIARLANTIRVAGGPKPKYLLTVEDWLYGGIKQGAETP